MAGASITYDDAPALPRSSSAALLTRLALWLGAFVGAGYLGRATIIDGSALSLIWPAAGITLLWFGTSTARTRVLDLVAFATATFIVNVSTGASPTLGVVFVMANLTQVLVVLFLGRRWLPAVWGFGGRRALQRLSELGRLVVAALLGCGIAAAIGSCALSVLTEADGWLTFLIWWGRNASGLVAVGLAGLLIGPTVTQDGAGLRALGAVFRPHSFLRALEAAALGIVTVAVYVVVFALDAGGALAFLLLAPTFWVGIRFTPLAATAHSMISIGLAVAFTILGDGPFSAIPDLTFQALVAQMCVSMTMLAALSLAFSHAQERQVSTELQALMDASRLAALISTDLDGTIRTFGIGAERLLGYRADALVGRCTPADFHDPAEVAAAADELQVPVSKVFAELARREDEARTWTFVRQDGQRIFVRQALSELRDARGHVSGYLSVAIDVTQTIQDQLELAEAHAQWEILVNNLPDLTVLTLDDTLRIGMVAGAGAAGTGLLGTEGTAISTVSNPDNIEVLRNLVASALADGHATASVDAAASGREHALVATPLPQSGHHREVLIVGRDVSTERARERALTEERDWSERLFQAAPHGVLLLTTDGTVVQANPAMARLLDLAEESLVRRPLRDYSAFAADPTLSDHLQATLRTPSTTVESTWRLRTDYGEVKSVLLSSTLLQDARRQTPGLILTNVVDVTEREHLQRQLLHLADHDPLTGLVNRRRFETELQRHLDWCDANGYRGVLLMIDLDNFKTVNDQLGHSAGDRLLIDLSRVLRRSLSGEDWLARLGGDEFAVLVPNARVDDADGLAADLVAAVREHTAGLEPVCRGVTASVGGVGITGPDASHVMHAADLMLYAAKRAGRNRYAIA